jgi:hypothetical protein
MSANFRVVTVRAGTSVEGADISMAGAHFRAIGVTARAF